MRVAGHLGLAPPGAGIPSIERFRIGLSLRFGARLRPSPAVTAEFLVEGRRILDLIRPVPEDQARLPILIPRLPGLEDASRYWSLYMVLEHLIQVDTAIWVLIRRLAAGRKADVAVRIEAFKPSADAGPERIDDFRSLIGRYTETLYRLGDLRGQKRVRHAHPWFGELTAAQWNLLAARHHRLHARQVERILEGLQQTG